VYFNFISHRDLGPQIFPNSFQQITLIDKSDRFTFKPLLYELLNNTATEEEVAPSFSQLLAPYPVRFIQVCLSHVIVTEGLSHAIVTEGLSHVMVTKGLSHVMVTEGLSHVMVTEGLSHVMVTEGLSHVMVYHS
jgi:hypothetical protein